PRMHLNTAISAFMELVNELYAYCNTRGLKSPSREVARAVTIHSPATAATLREAVETLVLLLSPFTPHLSEELWERLAHTGDVVTAGWPEFDAAAAAADVIEVPVQVNGKVRTRMTMPAGSAEDAIRTAALGLPALAPHLAGMDVV